jgi:hypothetical protein
MSSNLNRLLGLPDDSREVELTRSLLDKTKQGKIPWVRQGTALTAAIPGGLHANFVLAPTIFATPSNWQLFTVRDSRGNELVRVSGPGGFAILAGAAMSPLVAAANDLFRAVHGAVGDDLDRAIDSIKKL